MRSSNANLTKPNGKNESADNGKSEKPEKKKKTESKE
jgi:hypothetical protein